MKEKSLLKIQPLPQVLRCSLSLQYASYKITVTVAATTYRWQYIDSWKFIIKLLVNLNERE